MSGHQATKIVATIAIGTVGIFVAMFWGIVAHRLLVTVLGVATFVAFCFASFRRRRLLAVSFLVAWIGSAVSPVALSLRSVPGPPRLVPLVTGTLSDEGKAAADRGEFV